MIDEVHMLTNTAFNAMLKTLEEPPAHVKFILATTDPQKVPVTVLSRCLQFSLRNMTPQQVAGHLAHMLDVEGIAYETPALALLGRAAAGSMRDAQSLLDQAIAYGLGEVKEDGVRAMLGAVDKRYLAVVRGHPPERGVIEHALYRHRLGRGLLDRLIADVLDFVLLDLLGLLGHCLSLRLWLPSG